MAEKQPHLNGAYYGPNIPPSQKYHRPGRGSGCGGCCCLLTFLLKLIITVVIIIGIAVLVFWLIFRPNKVKFHVTDAKLTEFNYNNNTMYYNLTADITIRNPNKKIGIYYDSIEARAIYEGQRLGSNYLDPFYQGHKNTSVISPVFNGQQIILLSGADLTNFNADKTAGVYNIEVKLYLRIRFKVGRVKTTKFKPKIECDLKVPLTNSNGSLSGAAFQTTKCDLEY